MNEVTSNTLRRQLDELAAFEPIGFPFVSLYLNAQPDQHGRDNFEPFVRKEFNRLIKSFPADSRERESIERDAGRIALYLSNELRPSANGVVIFACAGAENYFKTIQLDVPIFANSLHVSDGPHLYPLANLVDRYPRYVAVVADTDIARLFVFDLNQAKRTEELDNTGSGLARDGVRTHLRYRRRVEKYNLLHAKEVARMLERVVREEGAEHIVLAGDDLIIPLLRQQLPAHIVDKVVDVLRLDIRTPEHEILKATMAALRDDNFQTDAEKVRDLLDTYESVGSAIVGVGRTLNGLALGQVEELLISAALEEIRVGEEAKQGFSSGLKGIAASAGNTNGDGKLSPETIVDTLISLARSTDAAITFIEDSALLSDIGGVGAFLRYREK
jgi:peptide subunit release factor 1 (eRF1)